MEEGWPTKWRARSKWIVACSAWPTAPSRPSVTRTTTVLLTRRASSTHTTLRWSPTRPTLSLTALGTGSAAASRSLSERHGVVTCLLACGNYTTSYITLELTLHVWSFIFCVNSSVPVAFSLSGERKRNIFSPRKRGPEYVLPALVCVSLCVCVCDHDN